MLSGGPGPAARRREIEELMASFGEVFRPDRRPSRNCAGWARTGVVHLALASLTMPASTCGRSAAVPLWKLLVDLSPKRSWRSWTWLPRRRPAAGGCRPPADARGSAPSRTARGSGARLPWVRLHRWDGSTTATSRYAPTPGGGRRQLHGMNSSRVARYGATCGVRSSCADRRPRRRADRLDANQRWTLPVAVRACLELAAMNPYLDRGAGHPDDVLAHQTLARAIAPIPVAVGEHIPHRVLFRTTCRPAPCFDFRLTARVGGIQRVHYGEPVGPASSTLPVVPHGRHGADSYQHLVLFNHVALGRKDLPGYIPHLRDYFRFPAHVADGVYRPRRSPTAVQI